LFIYLHKNLTRVASLEGLKSIEISYQTNEMLFRTMRSLSYLGEYAYDITLMWIPSHIGIQANERAHVLANEVSIDVEISRV
jgi:ribonuclease HI